MTKVKTNSKKQFEETIKQYRANGYNLITFTKTFAELEKENKIVVVER